MALLLVPLWGRAQQGLGSWNILNLQYTLNKKWSFFAEGQIRSLRFYNDFHYHEYKAGINYQARPGLRLTLAAGDYDTYREGGDFKTPKNNDEFRLWPQVLLQQSFGRFKVEQRYRAEFRFTVNGYRTRFRYRLGLAYPLGEKKLWQVGASNELFFTTREPYFERNRLLLSLQRRLNRQVSVQAGYLHQFDYRINDETGRDFLQLGLYLSMGNTDK